MPQHINFRPPAGYRIWEKVPQNPTKYKVKWNVVGVWGCLITFSLLIYVELFVWLARFV